MKRILFAAALSLAAAPFAAQADDVQKVFPDGYVVLSAADLAPRADAVAEWEIRKDFPQPSYSTAAVLSPEDLAPRRNVVEASTLIAQFPKGATASN